MDSTKQIDEPMSIIDDFKMFDDIAKQVVGIKIHYCPMSIVRGFPIDWNPGGHDPFVMSPQYPDILMKVARSHRAYKRRLKDGE